MQSFIKDEDWYHTAWPELRKIGLLGGPQTDQVFFCEALAGARRVLIAGAADEALPVTVAQAVRETSAALTLVDRSSIPLASARSAVNAAGGDLSCRKENILQHKIDVPYSHIVVHSLLGFFDEADRMRLLTRFRALLRRGGRVVGVQRLREGAKPLRRSAAEIEDFAAGARSAAEELGMTGAELNDLLSKARVFAERMTIHPVGDRRSLIQQFENAGFAMERLEARSGKAALPSASERVQFIAIAT